jgi:hypothetical protein
MIRPLTIEFASETPKAIESRKNMVRRGAGHRGGAKEWTVILSKVDRCPRKKPIQIISKIDGSV